jgi:hypothetical protein
MKHPMKISYNLGDYNGIKPNDIPKQIRQYVKYHTSVYDPIRKQFEDKLANLLETVEEQPEKLPHLQEFIDGARDNLNRLPEVIEDVGVFYGDLDRCVRDSEGKPFWIDFAAMEDDRIAYWKTVITDTESMIQYTNTLTNVTETEKAVALAKCEEKLKEAKIKSMGSDQFIKRTVFGRKKGVSK